MQSNTKPTSLLQRVEDLEKRLAKLESLPSSELAVSQPAKKRKTIGKDYSCWVCGAKGVHLTQDCPHKKDDWVNLPYEERYPYAPKQKVVCWKCGGEHKSVDCPDKDYIEGYPFKPVGI